MLKDYYYTDKEELDALRKEKQQLKEQYDLLNAKYCEEMDKNIALAEQLKQSQKEAKGNGKAN